MNPWIITQLNRSKLTWGAGASVTYSFAESLPRYAANEPEYAGFHRLNDFQRPMVELALSTWSDVADIKFIKTGHTGTINFANSLTLPYEHGAHAYLPSSDEQAGDIWINGFHGYNINPEIGEFGFHVLVHEIGHAIGQLHPGDYNGWQDGEDNPAYFEDSRQFSSMSFWSETNTGADYLGSYAQTPMLHDIAAIQAKYGTNTGTRSGDTVYGFNSNTASEIYDFSTNETPVFSIWDAGGIDTLDFTGLHKGVVLNLNQGSFSSTHGMTSNISIAYGADIENAATGSGNDAIHGNELNNLVNAGAGHDTFILDLTQADANTYVFSTKPIYVQSAHGVDELHNVEAVQFLDGGVSVASLPETSLLEYGASYADLISVFGSNQEALYSHLINHGLFEGREISFSGLEYINGYADLQAAFGQDAEAGALHYIQYGMLEGREWA